MPTVLIAGATGLVGEAAIARFAQSGWDVVTAACGCDRN